MTENNNKKKWHKKKQEKSEESDLPLLPIKKPISSEHYLISDQNKKKD